MRRIEKRERALNILNFLIFYSREREREKKMKKMKRGEIIKREREREE